MLADIRVIDLEIRWASRPRIGERVSGDAVVVRNDGRGRALVGVIDALGHGARAAVVAESAMALLSNIPLELDVAQMMRRLHRHLHGSRGVAAQLLIYGPDGWVDLCGVGNIAVRSEGTRLAAFSTPGIVGRRVAEVRSFRQEVIPGDRHYIYSDGIVQLPLLVDLADLDPRGAAQHLLQEHSVEHDDATVAVVDIRRAL